MILFLLTGMYFAYISVTKHNAQNKTFFIGEYDPQTRSLNQKQRYEYSYDMTNFKSEEEARKDETEAIEGALLRACKTLHTLSLLSHCSTPYQEDTIWGFVDSPGSVGSLNAAWSGTTSTVFSCNAAQKASYGRGLIQKAIPSEVIINGNYQYDLGGMQNSEATDPCSYSGIVSR